MATVGFCRAGAVGLAAIGLALWAGFAAAAAPPLVPSGAALSREEANPAQQTQPSRRLRPPDIFNSPIREPCELSDSPSLAFELRQGDITDEAKVLSAEDHRFAWGEFIGKRITPRQLCEIRDRLAERVFKHGVLARVIIPPQTISGGVVRFRVIAARIVSVRFDGDDIGPAQAEVEAYLNHLRHQAAFSLDDAQKWLLLVNDLPGVQAVAKIAHSSAPGAPPEGLDLIVTVRRTPVDETALIANANAKTLGPWTGLARVDLNSFTRWGERTSLVAYTTLGNNRQQVFQILESVRLGDSGLFAQASFAYGHSRPGNVLAPLDLTGDSYVGTVEFDYPLVRLQRQTVMVATGLDLIDQSTVLPTGQAISDDTLRVVWMRVDSAVQASDRPWAGNLVSTAADLSLQGRKGLDALGASRPGDLGLSRPGGFADAWVLRAEGHASIRIAPDDPHIPAVTLGAHLLGQWADRPLLAYEQQAIGNLTIGRGYDPGAASGDRVLAEDVRFEVGPLKLGKAIRFTPYLFEDLARVSYLRATSPDLTLASWGGGISFRIPYDARGDAIRMDLGYARPLDRISPLAAKDLPERFLVQIVVNH